MKRKTQISKHMIRTRCSIKYKHLKSELIEIEEKIKFSINEKLLKDENIAISKIKSDSKAFYAFTKNKGKNNNGIGPLASQDGNITSDQVQMANILLA